MMNDTGGDSIDVDTELYPALIQCFFIIAAGYIAGQLNLLTNTQAVGLSRFIGNFALPAIIFKNLVDIQFASVSWEFLGSVMLAKTIVFVSTALLAGIAVRPRNFTTMAIYAIMTTQTNDFALIAPIIDAVFKQNHPDFQRYVYLIAPINLVILNPIGFFLIEIQNRLDDQKKREATSMWQRCHLIRKILLNIALNPIVLCTVLGVIFNRIFNEHLPNMLEQILTPISQSFTATALFYLGLTMVGKLRHLRGNVVITVLLLCVVKLIIAPLVLRQLVYFFVTPINGSLNNTIDYSNLGFLYSTAPTAPSVIVYIPESNVGLQAIASTGLVLSTLLAGPIMLISAKMINLKALDSKTTEAYASTLVKTANDVSFISLFCTIIVLIGFCVRRRLLKISFIHKYTFIFVGLQMIHAIWTIAVQYITQPVSETNAIVISLGNVLTALVTRAWATSLSIILMISICYSKEHARRYFWVYHLFGWLFPICTTLIMYLTLKLNKSQDQPVAGVINFGTIQISVSVCFLALCIIINTANLLRIARRRYKLKHQAPENRGVAYTINENNPLVENKNETSQNCITIQSTSTDVKPLEADTQFLRHAILVGVLNLNAFICMSILSWSLLVQNQDGVYYELEFLDTVLLHGQGIVTFLVFALDADLILPIKRRIVRLFKYIGLKFKNPQDNNTNQISTETSRLLDFEQEIRPDFIRHSSSTQSMNSSSEPVETIFNGNDFCQWLVTNGHMDDQSKAQTYCQELVNNKQIVCIDRRENSVNRWYAFTK